MLLLVEQQACAGGRHLLTQNHLAISRLAQTDGSLYDPAQRIKDEQYRDERKKGARV